MSWIILIVAGLLEVCWAVGLRYTDGFTRLLPSSLVSVAIVGSLYLLSVAVRSLPLGTAYAVWVGIGILGTVLADYLLFRQPLGLIRSGFLCLLLISIVGLKVTAPPQG